MQLAAPVGTMEPNLCSVCLSGRARLAHLACSGLAVPIPRKKISFVEQTHKVRNFLTMSVMESQKASEDRQNIEKLNDSRGFIVLQIKLAFFKILIQAECFCHIINPSLSKREVEMVEY